MGALASAVFRLVSAAFMVAGGFLASLAGASLLGNAQAAGAVSCVCQPAAQATQGVTQDDTRVIHDYTTSHAP
jgi:hypothetical protein